MRNKFLGTGDPGYHPIRKIKTSIRGVAFAVRYDFSVAYKLALSVVVIIVTIFMRETADVLLVLLATAVMLMGEVFNSAIEAMCDYLTEKDDPRIGAIKDMAAGAVALSILAWLAVLVVEVVLSGAFG